MDEDLKSGIICPFNATVYKASNIKESIKSMTTDKYIGKILLNLQPSEPLKVLPRFYCRSEESIIIVGGLGGFGMELADWLISRRCRKLVLCSRSGVTNGYQAFRIKFVLLLNDRLKSV